MRMLVVIALLFGQFAVSSAQAALFDPGTLGDLALELFDSRAQAQLLGQLERTPVPVTPSPRARRLARALPTQANPLARAYQAIALGQYEKAETLLSEVRGRIENGRTDSSAALDFTAAEIASYAGREKEALELWRKAFATGSNDPVLNAALATSLWLADPRSLSAEQLDASLQALTQDSNVSIDRRLAVRRVLSFARLLDGRYDELDRVLSDYLKKRLDCGDCPWDSQLPNVQRILAAVRKLQGRLDEAETLYRQALEWVNNAPRSQRGDFPRVALQQDLARLYSGQGRLDEARSILKESGVRFEQELPASVEGLAYLRDLAFEALKAGRLDQAGEALNRAESLIQTHNLPPYPWSVEFLGLRATMRLVEGQRTQAEIDQRRALSLTEHELGPADPRVGNELLRLANVFLQQNRTKEALARLDRALQIERSWPRRDPRREAHILFLTGMTYLRLGATPQSVNAVDLLKGRRADTETDTDHGAEIEADSTQSKRFSDARILLLNGGVSLDLGITEQTSAVFEELLQLHQEYPDSIDATRLGVAQMILGNIYVRQGRYADARPLLMAGLAQWQDQTDKYDPRLITGLNALGLVNWKLGRLGDAEQAYSRAATLLAAATLNAGHSLNPELLAKLKLGLGRVYYEQGEHQLALEQLDQGLEIARKGLDDRHPLRAEIRGLKLSTERRLARQEAEAAAPAPELNPPPNQ
jgi:tetratricopeptide (TPR) repeat protein